MSKNKYIFFIFLIGFLALIINELFEELKRNNLLLKNSISGLILSKPEISRNIVKTDNAYILLFEPETLDLIALKIVNPFLPPVTFSIGQEDAEEPLRGSYRLLVITDKNRNINLPFAGEAIGPLMEPISLGTEGVKYYLDRPFEKLPTDFDIVKSESHVSSISGTVYVSSPLRNNLDSNDRLVIMLFDLNKNRPAAIKILTNFNPPQKFSIGQLDALKGQILKGEYSLRILTDKNNQPFQSFPGEIVGRSKSLVSMGTQELEFELDQKYIK